jgi:hypothetical protein
VRPPAAGPEEHRVSPPGQAAAQLGRESAPPLELGQSELGGELAEDLEVQLDQVAGLLHNVRGAAEQLRAVLAQLEQLAEGEVLRADVVAARSRPRC